MVAPRRQVGRRLNIHFTTEDEARQGNGLEHFMVRRLWMITHWDIRLGAEILDDNFLDMAVAAMKIANSQKGVDSFLPCFADANQNARRKWNAEFPGLFHRAQAHGWFFIRRIVMGTTGEHEPLADIFQHQPHAYIDLSQPPQVSLSHHAGIGVRQKFGFFQDGLASFMKVIERAPMAPLRQKALHFGVNRFRLIAEAEQDFGTTERLSLPHNF